MKNALKPVLTVLLIVCAAANAHAVTAGIQRDDMFHWLFPNPSNNNGYEEFVRAAEMIQRTPEVNEVMQPGATLGYKRKVLAMPRIAMALSLVKDGLAKPISPPRATIDENTLFPEFAMFRALTRLFAVEEYVNLADGHVDAAIESLRTGLSFAYHVQMDTLIAGLVGISMESIVIKGFAEHLDSLSVFQCDRIVALMKEFLAADKPGTLIMAQEKVRIIQMLENRRSSPDLLMKLVEGDSDDFTTQQINDITTLKGRVASDSGLASQADKRRAGPCGGRV